MGSTVVAATDKTTVKIFTRVHVNFVGEQDRLADVAGQAGMVWL
jgi:hypothetical protein